MKHISKPRNSNIELLRIISMIFIVMGHFNLQAEFNIFTFSLNSILVTVLGSGSRIAVNIFLIISVWFMVDAQVSGKRIISIWSQVAFYTYILTTLMLFLHASVSIKDIFRGYLPFVGRSLWFASAYITLMLIAPFLKRVFTWKLVQQRLLLIISFAAICLVSTLPDKQEVYLCDSLWFWFVYLAVGYYKKEVYGKRKDYIMKLKWPAFIMGGVLYIGLALALHIATIYRNNGRVYVAMYNLASQYISDIKTLPNIVCAFMIFNFVILCKERKSTIIQKIATASFSVYIIHQVPAFIQFLWKNLYHADMFRDRSLSVLYMAFVAVSIYVVVLIIDNGRRVIEKKWIESATFIKLARAIDRVFEHADLIKKTES